MVGSELYPKVCSDWLFCPGHVPSPAGCMLKMEGRCVVAEISAFKWELILGYGLAVERTYRLTVLQIN